MKIIVLIPYLLLATLTAFVVAACNGTVNNLAANSNPPPHSPATSADCQTIQHTIGKTQICGQLQRIVVLGPYLLESLLALEVQPAGFADQEILHQGNYDRPSQQIPYLGSRITSQPVNVGTVYSPSIEKLLKIRPDLILGTEENANQYAILSKIAPTLLLKWSDSKKNLRTIAQAVGRTDKAEQVLTKTQQRIATARAAFAPTVTAHPRVSILTSGGAEFYLINATNNLCSSLVNDLGFQLVYPPKLNGAKLEDAIPVSSETLAQLNDADSLILLGSSSKNSTNGTNKSEKNQSELQQTWANNAIAQSLKASKDGRVYFMPVYVCMGLPGPIGTELYLNELQQQLLPR